MNLGKENEKTKVQTGVAEIVIFPPKMIERKSPA